jgi:hypothetical protein
MKINPYRNSEVLFNYPHFNCLIGRAFNPEQPIIKRMYKEICEHFGDINGCGISYEVFCAVMPFFWIDLSCTNSSVPDMNLNNVTMTLNVERTAGAPWPNVDEVTGSTLNAMQMYIMTLEDTQTTFDGQGQSISLPQ